MVTIKVRMKRGGYLRLEANGWCVVDRDGAGQRIDRIEDLELYWTRKRGDKRSYLVKPELVADWGQVEEEFWSATKGRRSND